MPRLPCTLKVIRFIRSLTIKQLSIEPQTDYIHRHLREQPFNCGVQHSELYVRHDFPSISETVTQIRIKPATVESTLRGIYRDVS